MSLLNRLKKNLPLPVIKIMHDIKLHVMKTRVYRHCWIVPKAKRIRKKKTIKVLFVIHTTSMWKVDSVYKSMKKHPRFEVEILISPNMSISDDEARTKDLNHLRSFFTERNYHYLELSDKKGNTLMDHIPDIYDIIVYTMPWQGSTPKALDFIKNAGRILICCGYSCHSLTQSWEYNKWLQNAAWLDFYENEITYRQSCKAKDNRGANSLVTGLPIMDDFSRKNYHSPWKTQATPCKKIIWAPHWTITESSSVLPSYSHFLEMADFMLAFAKANMGKIQFAFKPHPTLKRELYKHPNWGKEKTDTYYQSWHTGENTQIEEGEYVDLFMTSDAMVHDSCSFCCEYMLTGKPVLFMVKNEERQVSLLNEMGRSAFYAQYLGYSISDLEQFLEKQVMLSNDPKQAERDEVVAKYLSPPHGKTAAENIIQAILGV